MKIQLLFVLCFLINFFSLKSSARENYSEFLYQRSAWETDNHIHNDTTSVVGIVLDIQYRPIESAVVVLMRSDTTHVEAVITNKNGEFVFSKHISPYLLTVQHIAYKSFMVRSNNVSTDTIILEEKENMIAEVAVTAQRPAVVLKDDGALSYNAESLRRNRPVANALGLLDEVPCIQRTGDKYDIVGAQNSTIILDGRKSNMSASQIKDFLLSLPPERIETIDVFYNTPPQYGVKGASINIITRKNRTDTMTLNGSINTTVSLATYYSQSLGANLMLSDKKWSWNLGYTAGTNKTEYDLTLNSHHKIDGNIHDINLNSVQLFDNSSHKVYSNFNWDLGNKSELKIFYNGQFTSPTTLSSSKLSMDNIQSESENRLNGKKQLHTINAVYTNKSLEIGADYLSYDEISRQDLRAIPNSDSSTDLLQSASSQDVNKYTIYLNNKSKVGKGTLTYGAEAFYSVTENGHNTLHDSLYGDDNSYNLVQEELSLSAFVSYAYRLGKKGMLNMSLKGEYFNATIETEEKISTLWKEFYLFPSLSLAYRMHSKASVQVALSSNKTYPAYWTTNPNRSYMNPYSVTEGNPLLKPYESYQLNANCVLDKKYIVGLFGNISPHYSTQLLYQEPDKLLAKYKYYNFDFSNKYGILGVIPVQWNKSIDTKLTANLFLMHQKGCFEDIRFDRMKIAGRINASNNFVLNTARTVSLQLSGWYQLPVIQGIYDVRSMYDISLGASWQPKDSGWNISLKADDVFNFYIMDTSASWGSQSYRFRNLTDSRRVSLTVKYTFKNYKSPKYKEIDKSRIGI